MPDDRYPYSFAIFPFLKTSAPVAIGPFTLRSTTDTGGLEGEQVRQLAEISQMLFLQDHLRILSASYTLVPLIDLDHLSEHEAALEELAHLQSFVAYCYASPHPIFCEPHFRYEHASLVILSPGRVSIYVVRPDHHVEWVGVDSPLVKDHRSEIEGYHGLYNFIHHFWATDGSRLYPPIPHIGLNIPQNLAADFGQFLFDSSHLPLLLKLFEKPRTATSERILRALDWFNGANSVTSSEEESIVSLAVGFETLLGLPEGDKKTERLVDSVALLLGRIPRLESWVRQFYRARSEIVHEGQTRNLRFVAGASTRRPDGPLYHSLLNYGRQVFQLCVGALLFGAALAEKAGLQEKLVTNQERFEEISKELSDESIPPADRLRRISLKVQQAENYRFVSESSFNIDKILHSVRSASESLLVCDLGLEADVKDCLGRIISAGRANRYAVLDGLRELDGLIARSEAPREADEPREVAFRLFRLAWACTFMNYFWLKEESESKAEPEPGQAM